MQLFYGSIQIFQYLRLSNVDLLPSLWLFIIHGKNPELIHILEENKIEPELNNYQICLVESIKCHHNEFAYYFLNNYLNGEDQSIKPSSFKNHFRRRHKIPLPNTIHLNLYCESHESKKKHN